MAEQTAADSAMGSATYDQMLRAFRFGFRWCPVVQAFMRIEATDGPPWVVHLAAADSLPSRVASSRTHLRWWDDGNTPSRASPVLRALAGKVSGFRTLYLDDDGLLAEASDGDLQVDGSG